MNLFETKIAYRIKTISKPLYIEAMYQWHRCLFDYADLIRDTDISSIEITDGQVIMTSRSAGIKILCNKEDRRIAPIEILNFDFYEQNDFNMIIKLMRMLCSNHEGRINFFDIGANIGWHSLNVAKQFKDAKVFAFEPIPVTFNSLKQNIELNKLNNIHPQNFGFSNCEQTLIFYYYPEGSGNASSTNLVERTDSQEIFGVVKKLDDFVFENNLTIEFIKCDVEGAELFVYEGGIESIKRDNPVIFTEMLRKWSAKFNYHPNEIINLLATVGYRCFVTKEEQLVEFFSMDENTVETNFFFLHTVKHIDLINYLVVV